MKGNNQVNLQIREIVQQRLTFKTTMNLKAGPDLG